MTIAFSGQISPEPQYVIVPPQLSGLVSPGDSVTGSFRYGTEAIDLEPNDSRIGLYVFTHPQFYLEMTVGQVHLSTDPAAPYLWVQILDGYPLGIAPDGLDRFMVSTRLTTPWSPNPLEPTVLQLSASDFSRTAISSTGLPIEPLDLRAFEDAHGEVGSTGPSTEPPTIFIPFQIAEWHAIPEADRGLLLALAGAALAFGRRAIPASRHLG